MVLKLPSRCRVLVLALVLAAATLAGCFGSLEDDASWEDEDQEDATHGDEEDDKEEDKQEQINQTLLRFPLEAAFTEQLWVNGSFEPQETGAGGGFLTGAFQKRVDLSDLVPAEVPTRLQVSVTMDAQEVPFVGPTGRADPSSNDTVWYDSTWKNPEPGRFEMSGLLKRSEDGLVGLLLEAYLPGAEGPPEMGFSLQASVTARPDSVPDRVPVAVQLAGNDTINVQVKGEEHAELLVYGPDDALVGRLFFFGQDDWTVPPGRAGEFVLLPVLGSGDIKITKQGEAVDERHTMRALGFREQIGQPRDVEPFGTTSWTFEVDELPLRVYVTLAGPSGEPWMCNGVATVRLSSPEGTILDRSVECPSPTNVPFLYEEAWTWEPGVGDPRLVAGTYEVSVEADLWYGHQVVRGVEWYER